MTAKKGEFVKTYPHKSTAHPVSAQPQKRGAKPYYAGSRLAFLEGYHNKYISLCGKKHQQFWDQLLAEWWEKYPWHLKDHEEPPTNDHKKILELVSVGTDEDLKKEIEAKTQWVSLVIEIFQCKGDQHGFTEDVHLVQLLSLCSQLHQQRQFLDSNPQMHSQPIFLQALLLVCSPTAYAQATNGYQQDVHHAIQRWKGYDSYRVIEQAE